MSHLTRGSSFVVIQFLACLFLWSCQSSRAFDPRAERVDVEKGSLVLVSLRTRNDHRPDYTPHVDQLVFESIGAPATPGGSAKRTFVAVVSAQPAETPIPVERVGWYAAQLPPGEYRLTKIKGSSQTFWVRGWFSWPVDWSFRLAPGEVLHLGDGSMVNRKRAKGEERSGGIFPIVDQSVSGYAESTFDVALSPADANSAAGFRRKYKALAEVELAPTSNAQGHAPRP